MVKNKSISESPWSPVAGAPVLPGLQSGHALGVPAWGQRRLEGEL